MPFHSFSGHGPFLVAVPSGEALVAVLPVSLSLSSTCWIHYGLLPLPSSTGTSPTTPRPQSEGFSFVLSYSLFSLNCSMYVSVETRYYFCSCCDVKVLISGDDIPVNIYFLLYVFCWNDLKSKNDAIFLGYT
jgi:hypothetical protein